MLELKLGSAEVNAAVMTCEPAEVNAKAQVGTVPVVVIGFEHKVVAGVVEVSANTTVPALGTTLPGNAAVSVAVKIADWFTVDVAGDDVIAVVVPDALTV